ncbi:MAG: AbrB family transcriptional regulator [Rhodocyclaceae bacterium]|nr:AbrB family transcriptional regulator [Rhodocyclaceae bacterium]
MRILLVVLIVPSAMYWSGAHGSHPYAPANLHFEPGAFALMAAAALASAGLLYRLGLPNAWMLGPLFMVMGLTLAEVPASAIPQALVNVAQALIGCTLGSRFERKFLLRAPRFIAAAAASILGALLISAAWGMLVAVLTGIPVASAILATAPGGIAEMCITAKVLHLGVPIVTAFHVTRVLLIVTGAPPIYALLRKLRAKD